MLVFGDRSRSEDPRQLLGFIQSSIGAAAATAPGIVRHDHIVSALIKGGVLAQGLADAEMARVGCDRSSPIQTAAMGLVAALAQQVGASWSAGFFGGVGLFESEVDAVAVLDLPGRIEAKQPEGFGFYALYPEAFFEAAKGLPAEARVIGLRSIGTSLAAMVAVGAGASLPVSVRPVGHPFARRFDLDPGLMQDLVHNRSTIHAIVDEGPGLSGSSFGALADELEAHGVPTDSMVFFPGHIGPLGGRASPRHAHRWSRADRRVAAFDDVILPRLAAAVEDLTGPAIAPMDDLSGGRWRAFTGADRTDWPPVNGMQERRKFRLQTKSGVWLLKFAGLGDIGRPVFEDALRLHAAGFCPEPVGLRLGFLVQRWEQRTVALRTADVGRDRILDMLGRYLSFRATLAAPGADGASLAMLADMTRCNVAEALGEGEAAAWQRRYGRFEHHVPLHRVRTDNRLHLWEWLRIPGGGLIKCDATDHCRGHDLIGCQDIAWDVAGAQVEFDLSPVEVAILAGAVGAARRSPIDQALIDWLVLPYLAFQLGHWSMAAEHTDGDERRRVESLLSRYRSMLLSKLQVDGVNHSSSGSRNLS